MKLLLFFVSALGGITVGNCESGLDMGKAKVQWQAALTHYKAGKPLQTAFIMHLEEGWHTYWENPGDAGMRMKVSFELPTGWKAGELEFPAPSRFETGGLNNYGYTGTVSFPMLLYPPAEAQGPLKLKAKLSWLVCNEEACLPGNADMVLNLTSGPPEPSIFAESIKETLRKIPRFSDSEITLAVLEESNSLRLTITVGEAKDFLPLDYHVFPVTAQVIDGDALYDWIPGVKSRSWQAILPKSEYLNSPVQELDLVFVSKHDHLPLRVNWKIN